MRVLLIGDGCTLTTGFAQVLRQCAVEFTGRGWDVHQLACLDIGPSHDSEAYKRLGVTPWFANPYDHIGKGVFPLVYEKTQPDVLFINSDPGTASQWFGEFHKALVTCPTVLYAPVEGAPIAPSLARAFEQATVAYTYTQWSADRLRAEYQLEVPWVYHGVDADTFHPFTSEDKRRETRRRLGWEGKYVVIYVGRNAGRKHQPALIKALAELKAAGVNDVQLYLHCKSWDNNQLQGWDLRGVAHYCGVTDAVQFADQTDAAQGEAQISLAAKYAAADLYVHAAKVEGFGLPILEAMASGLPVIVPGDRGNMEEVAGGGTFLRIDPPDWETWFNGAQLATVTAQQFAQAIATVKEAPVRITRAAGERARTWAQRFSWVEMRNVLADAVAEAVSRESDGVESEETRESVPA